METLNKFIKKNYKKLTKEEIAKSLNVDAITISTKFSWLKRKGEIPVDAKILTLTPLNVKALKKETNKSNTYNNEDGDEKEIARDIMVSKIMDTNKNWFDKPILSLPADKFKIEKKLIALNKDIRFKCCERDIDTYKKMNILNANDNLLFDLCFTPTERGGIGAVIRNAREHEFSHLILDYCGQINPVAPELISAMQNNIIPVEGLILLTLNNRGDINKGVCKEMLYLCPSKLSDDKVIQHCIKTLIMTQGQGRYRIEEAHPYNDVSSENGKTKGNMILFVIRRIK